MQPGGNGARVRQAGAAPARPRACGGRSPGGKRRDVGGGEPQSSAAIRAAARGAESLLSGGCVVAAIQELPVSTAGANQGGGEDPGRAGALRRAVECIGRTLTTRWAAAAVLMCPCRDEWWRVGAAGFCPNVVHVDGGPIPSAVRSMRTRPLGVNK